MSEAQPESIELHVEIAAPAERVWRFVVADETRRAWWSNLELEPRVGGAVVERWHDGSREVTTAGVIQALDPLRLLRATWRDDDWEATTQVELTLAPGGLGTRVRLRHEGWERLGPAAAALRAAHDEGWQRHLQNLKRAAEAGR